MSGFEDRAATWIQWARWPLDAYRWRTFPNFLMFRAAKRQGPP